MQLLPVIALSVLVTLAAAVWWLTASIAREDRLRVRALADRACPGCDTIIGPEGALASQREARERQSAAIRAGARRGMFISPRRT